MHNLIHNSFPWKVGKGMKFLFWHDKWLDTQDSSLKERSPRFYSLSTQKCSTVYDDGVWDNCTWVWYFKWRRTLFQWELDEVSILLGHCNVIILNPNKLTKISWSLNDDGIFSVKKFLEATYSANYTRVLPHDVIKFFWQKRAPFRAQVTLWFLSRQRLKTGDFLAQLNLVWYSQSLCPLCDSIGEFVDHLFFTCPVIWRLWGAIFEWWGMCDVLHKNSCPNIQCWSSLVSSKFKTRLWDSILFTTIWNI